MHPAGTAVRDNIFPPRFLDEGDVRFADLNGRVPVFIFESVTAEARNSGHQKISHSRPGISAISFAAG